LGFGGGAAPCGEAEDIDVGGGSLDIQTQAVADAKIVRGLGTLAVYVNLAAGYGLGGL
jgi:hypothetical protein